MGWVTKHRYKWRTDAEKREGAWKTYEYIGGEIYTITVVRWSDRWVVTRRKRGTPLLGPNDFTKFPRARAKNYGEALLLARLLGFDFDKGMLAWLDETK